MVQIFFSVAVVACVIGAGSVLGEGATERNLPVDGVVAPDGRAVQLSWFNTEHTHRGAVTVKRRILGQTGADSWQVIAPMLGTVMQFSDETTVPGVAYEYQVLRTGRDIIDVGYWAAGTQLPPPEDRAIAYLLVDETVVDALAAHLLRFVRDLRGAGWQVVVQTAPRGDASQPDLTMRLALDMRRWLRTQYAADPVGSKAVILVGHLPIVKSGLAAPDGHQPAPHATDLFYGDMDGRWTLTPEWVLADNLLPSDAIEMQVGRINFFGVSGGDPVQEVHLLRAYFDKNHHWRNGLLGDLRVAYGSSGHLDAELYGLRNIVGPAAITPGGHHDVGEQHPWLWGVDFGDWNGRRYADTYANKAVFSLNFGSGKQRVEEPYNAMTALLAQPWYPVAVGWGARPAWWLHHMALGGTIGDVHMRTVNNGEAALRYRDSMEYFPTGKYLWRNPIWVNLLGDPTLRAFPLFAPTAVQAVRTDRGVQLSWDASTDPDVQGYRVDRVVDNAQGFVPLSGREPVTRLTFTDTDAPEGARYMIRAYGLKQVHAGSFYTYSQGVFAAVADRLPPAEEITLRTPADQAVTLPAVFDAPTDTLDGPVIYAVISEPEVGRLSFVDGAWVYTPPAGFNGEVVLPITVSTVWQTATAALRINIGE